MESPSGMTRTPPLDSAVAVPGRTTPAVTTATAARSHLSRVRMLSPRGPPSRAGDGPLVVGAGVRRPQAHARADGRIAHAVQRRAGAPVDDLVPAVAQAVQPPLLVVAAV